MMNSQDVSEQELEVLRDDTVCKNLHISNWINNTLKSLHEIDKNGWTKELKIRLRTLWDLSTKEEVISHLMLHNFLKLAKRALVISNEPRLTEIILGIISNVCSSDKAAIDTIGCDRELVIRILSHLTSNNSLILIQLIKFLHSVVWNLWKNRKNLDKSDWAAHLMECSFFGDSVTFILKNSTNYDLLTEAISLLQYMPNINPLSRNRFWEKLFKMDDLIPAVLESFMQVISKRKESCFEWQFAENWLEVLHAIRESNHGLEFENYETDERFLKLMDIIYRILEPCKQPCNFYPIRKLGADIVFNITDVLSWFDCRVNSPRIHSILASITFYLNFVSVYDPRGELNSEEQRAALLKYLIGYWFRMFTNWTDEQSAEMLHLCEHDARQYLIGLLLSYP